MLHPLAAYELQALLWNKDPRESAVMEALKIVLGTEAPLWQTLPHGVLRTSVHHVRGRPHPRPDLGKGINRTSLSRMFCEETGDESLTGASKEMSCQVALLRCTGTAISCCRLPLQSPANNHLKKPKERSFPCPTARNGRLDLDMASRRQETSALWNAYIERTTTSGIRPCRGATPVPHTVTGSGPRPFRLLRRGVEGRPPG